MRNAAMLDDMWEVAVMRLSVLRMKRRALVRRITFALATVLCLSGPAPSVADRTVPEELEYEVHEFTESPFGIHVFASSKETLEEDLPVFSATGARWTRTARRRAGAAAFPTRATCSR